MVVASVMSAVYVTVDLLTYLLRLAAELESTSVQGGSTVAGRMFARRRDRAERSVVPEVPATRRMLRATPPETVVHQPVPQPAPTPRGTCR